MMKSMALRRSLHQSARRANLFGGKIANSRPLEAPGAKAESTANPADIFKKNDILMFSQKPLNYIESIKRNGFHLANSMLIESPDKHGNIIGTALLESESFEVNLSDGGFEIVNGFMVKFNEEQVLSVFEKIHPKPEILVLGLGKKSRMLFESNRKYLANLGIQLEVGDSIHSAHIFDLLATERPNVIAALLLPPNV